MAAFVRYIDPLLIEVDNSPAGENWYDNRCTFHPPTEIALTNGGLSGTSVWYRDVGPIGMAEALLEPRAFCNRGGCNWTFTGTTLLIRLNVAWSWFKHSTVLIDGMVPSTIPGILAATDELTCDSADYVGMLGDGYADVLVADGLHPGSHTVVITVDNLDVSKFFSIAGYKVGQLTSRPLLARTAWIVADPIAPNAMQLTITNRQTDPIAQVGLAFPPSLEQPPDGDPLSPFSLDVLPGGASVAIDISPVFADDDHSVTYDHPLLLSAYYPDPSGATSLDVLITVAADSPVLVFAPSPWITDTSTPGNVPRRFAFAQDITGTPWTLSFTFTGDALDITAQCALSWGVCGIYDGPTMGAALLATFDCGLDEGSALHLFHLTGFGPGDHTVYLRKTVNDAAPVVFIKAEWEVTRTFTQVIENVTLQVPSRQPIAMPVEDVVIGTYDATFDPPNPADADLVNVPVRRNTEIAYTETMQRFLTYAVFYGTGFRDLLAEYDVLIVDPIGAKTEDVEYWQSLGIKVYGYVASLEEIGFYEDRYDFASPIAPRKDGTGPGGYSENYMFTKFATTGEPDRNGVWASFYMDPREASGWKQRIKDYYVPQVYGGSVEVENEEVITQGVTIGAGPRIVFDVAQSPINASRDIIVTTEDGSHSYIRYQDFTYDIKTGAFVIAPTASPAVIAGQTLKVSYTRKGHQMDGIFWDVVDDVDIYLSDDWGFEYVLGHKEATAELINEIAAEHPGKGNISNRGFSVLEDIIESCDGVMFESWLTLPTVPGPWSPATEYYIVKDAETIDFNDVFNAQLRELRKRKVFNVYSLNYARNDPADDHLRDYCKARDAEHGYSSWVTVITLNDPSHNDAVTIGLPRVQSTAFTRTKIKGAA